MPEGTKPETFGGDDPYHVMFGPDLCGYDVSHIHMIFNHKVNAYLSIHSYIYIYRYIYIYIYIYILCGYDVSHIHMIFNH